MTDDPLPTVLKMQSACREDERLVESVHLPVDPAGASEFVTGPNRDPLGDIKEMTRILNVTQILEQLMKNDLDNQTEVPASLTSRRNFLGGASATVAAGTLPTRVTR